MVQYKVLLIGHRNQKLISIKRRPFEILAGTFVLSYFDDADTDAVIDSTHDLKIFHKERKRLNRLVQRDICLPVLHGPGGSGKTTVVDLVVMYAKQFCEYLKQPFTSNTIVDTRMSGVAATILLGETTRRTGMKSSASDEKY